MSKDEQKNILDRPLRNRFSYLVCHLNIQIIRNEIFSKICNDFVCTDTWILTINSKGTQEYSLSLYTLLFAEIIRYSQERSSSLDEVSDMLANLGKDVGWRLVDLLYHREKVLNKNITLDDSYFLRKTKGIIRFWIFFYLSSGHYGLNYSER